MIHRQCNDCGQEYQIEEGLIDMAVLGGGFDRERAQKECPICGSMKTEEVEE